MKKGELTSSGRLSRGHRYGWAVLLLACLLGAILWGGCAKEENKIVFPDRPQPEPAVWFYGIWGSSANNIFVVGQPGVILQYDGSIWKQETNLNKAVGEKAITAVWGAGANNVYACGHDGLILNYNGSSWSQISSGTSKNLYDIGPYLDGTVYCGGEEGVLRRLQGGSWVDTPNTIFRWNTAGTAFTDTLERTRDLLSLTTITQHGIGGDTGRVLMDNSDYDANSWQLKLVADDEWVTPGWSDVDEIPGNFLATESGKLYQLSFESDAFSWGEISSPASSAVYDMWSADEDTFYFATREGEVVRRTLDGSTEVIYDGNFMLYGIWGTDNRNIWAVGINSTIIHYDGENWTEEDVEVNVTASASEPISGKFGRSPPVTGRY